MDIKNYISSGVIEAYVNGCLPAEEASILECVAKNNKEVRDALFEMQETFEKLATLGTMSPPSELKEQIRSSLDFRSDTAVRSIAPVDAAESGQPYTLWLKAAVVAALFTLGFLGYNLNTQNTQLKDLAQSNAVLSGKISDLENQNSILQHSRKIALKGVENHPDLLAAVYWDSQKNVYLNMENMPAAPAGKQYQLWAIVEGKPVDLGVYSDEKDSLQQMKNVQNPQAFAITLEKEGGSPVPTMEQMMVLGEI